MKLTPWLLLPLWVCAVQAQASELPQSASLASARAVAQNTITRMIVKLHPQPSSISAASQMQSVSNIVSMRTGLMANVQRSTASGAYVMALPNSMSLAAAEAYAANIAADPSVEYAEPDKLLFPVDAITPDDPYYPDQWHYADPADGNKSAINLPRAWGLTQGNSSVIVAVVDTGAINHADLKNSFLNGNVSLAGRDFISSASNARDNNGRDSNPTDQGDWDALYDSSWHGTHVAGTIAAQSNNSYGVSGVNWKAKLLIARVLGVDGGYISDISDAVMWSAGKTVDGVANPNHAHVVNMSIGGSGTCSSTFQNAINYAVSQGTTVVVAAGNENKNVSTSEPANCNHVIAVAALEKNGARASFSNYGALVDIAAPGVSILSTLDSGTKIANNSNTYASYAGTSMATPHVSGVVSLMYSANPNLRNGTLSAATIPALIESKLKAAGRVFPTGITPACSTSTCGAGMLDAYRAVLAVSTPPSVNAGNDQTVQPAASVTLAGSATDDAFGGTIKTYEWTQVGGSTVTLTNANKVTANFVAPATAATLQFRLTATDDTGLSTTDDVNVTVGQDLTDPLLTVSKDGTGTGTVSSTPAGIDCGSDCQENYTVNTAVTLTATPNSDASFAGWAGACTGTANTCTVTMSAAKNVTATFTSNAVEQFTLNVSTVGTGKGNVSSTPSGIACGSAGTDCTETYAANTQVTLSATPNSGSSFAGWSGACSGSSSTCTVTLDQARTVQASFTATTTTSYALRVALGGFGDGKITSSPKGINCSFWTSRCAAKFTAGSTVTLTATPEFGSRFVKWMGACTGTKKTCDVTMDAAKKVTAVFKYTF